MSNSFGDIQQPCWHSSLPKPMSQDDVARLTSKVWHPNSGPKQNIHLQCINAWNIIKTSWSFWMDSWWLRLYMFSGVCSLYFVRILTSLVSQNRFGPRSHLSKSFSCFAHLAWSHAVWRVWRYKCHTTCLPESIAKKSNKKGTRQPRCYSHSHVVLPKKKNIQWMWRGWNHLRSSLLFTKGPTCCSFFRPDRDATTRLLWPEKEENGKGVPKKTNPRIPTSWNTPPSFKWEGVPFLQLENTPHCCNKKPTSRHVIAGHEEVLNDIIG